MVDRVAWCPYRHDQGDTEPGAPCTAFGKCVQHWLGHRGPARSQLGRAPISPQPLDNPFFV